MLLKTDDQFFGTSCLEHKYSEALRWEDAWLQPVQPSCLGAEEISFRTVKVHIAGFASISRSAFVQSVESVTDALQLSPIKTSPPVPITVEQGLLQSLDDGGFMATLNAIQEARELSRKGELKSISIFRSHDPETADWLQVVVEAEVEGDPRGFRSRWTTRCAKWLVAQDEMTNEFVYDNLFLQTR